MQQKISLERIFLLLSIIFSIGIILGLLLAIGEIRKINLPVLTPPIAAESIIEGKFVKDLGHPFFGPAIVSDSYANYYRIRGDKTKEIIALEDNTRLKVSGVVSKEERSIPEGGKFSTIIEKIIEVESYEVLVKTEIKSAVIGEEFLLVLPVHISSEYSWDAQFDDEYLILRNKDLINSKIITEQEGASSVEAFTFVPIKAGETMITMNYGRFFDSKPSETKVFKYNIKEKTAVYSNYGEVPNKYSDGSYSVKGFINNVKNLDNASFVLKGMVINKNECAPCPAGAMCAPCAPPHIFITDPVAKINDRYSVIVNFGDQEIVDQLKIGDNIEINASYNASGDGLTGENVSGSLWFLGFLKEKTAIDFYSCIQNSDCVSIKADCCGCTAGGKATSINKAYQSEWLDSLDCKDIMCPAVMSGDPSCISKEPKCENNKCTLK